MRDELRIPLYFFGAYILLKVLTLIFGVSYYYADVFIPLIPFFVLLDNYALQILLFVIMGFVSSVVYYDEMFANLLGYGISLILLLNFSKKYSLINLFNYLISVITASLIVFLVQMLSYFAKDKIIVFADLYQFVFINLFAGVLYYYSYRIAVFRSAADRC